MNRLFIPPLLLVLLTACHSLPAVVPAPHGAAALEQACRNVFPHRPWRMVHTITTDLAGGKKGVMIGVVSFAPAAEPVDCALLTIEGMRLFEARDDGTLTVRRALPPFDNPALAAGMMADIRLLLFPPKGPPATTGLRPGEASVCRFALADGVIDVMPMPGGTSRLERYEQSGRLIRRVDIAYCRPDGAADDERLPCRIHLEAFGSHAYGLDLDLIEARPAVDSPG